MLSIAPIAGGGAGYYTSQDNYYFLGSMQSRWLGKAQNRCNWKDRWMLFCWMS